MMLPLNNKIKQEIVVFIFSDDASLFSSKGNVINPDKYLDFRNVYSNLDKALNKEGYGLYDFEDMEIIPMSDELHVTWFGYKDNGSARVLAFEIIYDFNNFDENIDYVLITDENGDSDILEI